MTTMMMTRRRRSPRRGTSSKCQAISQSDCLACVWGPADSFLSLLSLFRSAHHMR